MVKVAICIPCYGDTKTKFTQCLANMLIHTARSHFFDGAGDRIELEVEVFIVSGSMLTEGRGLHALP
jgi:hypothetical protein